jgi:excisionase family DNA binding protein
MKHGENVINSAAKMDERDSDPHLLTKEGVAIYLRVTPRTVDNLMARGALPYLKIGRIVRFRLADVSGQN